MSDKSTFYLVREEILPEAIKKTIKVKNPERQEGIWGWICEKFNTKEWGYLPWHYLPW